MRAIPKSAPTLSRRRFLQAGAAAGTGLVVGFHLPGRAGHAVPQTGHAVQQAGGVFAPNAFVRIAPDNTVTVLAKHIEFGQGTYTGLATILADELDADWAQIRVESAPADAKLYNNLLFGEVQGTGGSTAIANSWEQLRKAGATARAMLIAAAARDWRVPASEITVERGVVSHAGSGGRASFGDLATKAASMTPPTDVKLKYPSQFKLIGTRVPRIDSKSKSDGTAQFTIDMYLPDMLTAVIARPPRFGAKIRSLDASGARSVAGVTDVVEVPSGAAVLARTTWAALKGRNALNIVWDESGAETRSSADLLTTYRQLAQQPGISARKEGDAAAVIDGAAKTIEAVYEFPYLAHAPMEPLDCVVRLQGSRCELWAGSQLQTVDQNVAAEVLGLPPENVVVHTLLGGGSFGRRATPNGDVASEAASIAKAINGRQPVKLIWTRDDDIKGGRYRPLYVHRLRAGLDRDGNVVGWEHRIVGQSILGGTLFESALVKNGVDETSVEGASDLPYAIPNLSVELHTTQVGVPVLWWRSVGHTHTAFSTETFIDELAYVAHNDPVEFRRALLRGHPRHLAALELAAQKAGWGTSLPEGRARGIAVHESFNSYVAQVAEVSRGADGLPKIKRVVCAVDCGVAVNPDVIRAQMEGGIGYGLGGALHSEIVLEQGRVRESNFHDYPPLRIEEMPAVEVHIVPSAEAPTGVGEPGVPPIAASVANAWFRLTGERVRRLPFAQRAA
jgi:isoquinoline 1-oxidoreductase beta subunit